MPYIDIQYNFCYSISKLTWFRPEGGERCPVGICSVNVGTPSLLHLYDVIAVVVLVLVLLLALLALAVGVVQVEVGAGELGGAVVKVSLPMGFSDDQSINVESVEYGT